MPWSRPCTSDGRSRVGSCTTATEECSTSRSATPNGWPRLALSPRSAASATQRPRGDHQRPLQGRGDPPARPLAILRGGGVRHARMGRLVQQAPPARTDRQLASRRGGSALLCPGRGTGLGRLTQAKPPPKNPARFTKVDSAAVQDGFDLYLHGFIVTDD